MRTNKTMMQIKDIISYLRFANKVDEKFVHFGYWDRVAKKIIYRNFLDIEQFESGVFKTFNIEDGKDLVIPHTRLREFYVNQKLVWWRHPETDINDYGCVIKDKQESD